MTKLQITMISIELALQNGEPIRNNVKSQNASITLRLIQGVIMYTRCMGTVMGNSFKVDMYNLGVS